MIEPIFGPRRLAGDIAIVALDIGKAMYLASELPQHESHRFELVLVGSPLYGARFNKAYASLDDLHPDACSDSEAAWMTSLWIHLPPGVGVTYLDV